MKASSLDHNEKGLPRVKAADTTASNIEAVELFVEELENVIAPSGLEVKLASNHNQTLVSDSE